jgi:hypothetical protein
MKLEELKNEFILDCKVRNLSPRTVHNYEKQLNYFVRFLKESYPIICACSVMFHMILCTCKEGNQFVNRQ